MPESNPYQEHADLLRSALADPTVNEFEHTIAWPRFKLYLPPKKRVNRILDFGCGPGNFTRELADLYPDAEIVGIDQSQEILPVDDSRITYRQWDGTGIAPDLGAFDLITAKMVLHYAKPGQLPYICRNIAAALKPGGRIVYSIPHPIEQRKAIGLPDNPEIWLSPQSYTTEIGRTGIIGAMTARDHTIGISAFLGALPDDYGFLMDDIYPRFRRTLRHPISGYEDDTGYKKRKIVALFPNTDYEQVCSVLKANGLLRTRPTHSVKVMAEMAAELAALWKTIPETPDE